jgi:TonB family protein
MTVLLYVVKTTFSLFLFYLLYKCIFKKEGILKFNRYFLLFSLIASFLLPFMKLNFNIVPDISTKIYTIQYNDPSARKWMEMPENVTPEYNSDDQTNIAALTNSPLMEKRSNLTSIYYSRIFPWSVIGLYLLGVLVLLFSFLYQFVKTLRLFKHHKVVTISNVKLIQHNLEIMPFSIFNYIIINRDHYGEQELEYVLLHEMEHINQKHSFDILLVELLKIVFWINPVIWLYEREIKQNHEYLADRGVLDGGVQTYDYQLILLNSSLGVPKYNIVNNFNQSYIKKRIKMMTNKKCNKLSIWKLLLIVPIVFTVVLACSKPSGSNQNGNTTVANEEISDYTKYIELNTPYDWVCYQGGNFFCKGTYTITKIDPEGNFEGIQENHTFETRQITATRDKDGKVTILEGDKKTNPITGKLTKDILEFRTGSPYNEIWKINKSESGKLVGKVFADYDYSRKSRKTFYLAKHIGYEELLPCSKDKPGMEISKNLHLKLFEKYFYENFFNDSFHDFSGWFMITTFNKETNEIAGHQSNFKGDALGAFSGKLYNDSIIINIGEPWNEVWKATLDGNLLKGPLTMNPTDKRFANRNGMPHRWAMAISSKPIVSAEKASELNAPYNVARYSELEQNLYNLLRNSLKYPEQAKSDSIEGKVYVSFNVMTDGSIANIKVERSVNPLLDAEALRLVKLTDKKWVAAVVDNQPIVSEYLLPIEFKLK